MVPDGRQEWSTLAVAPSWAAVSQALREINARIAASQDLGEILQGLLSTLTRVLPFDSGWVFLLEPETGLVRSAAAWDRDGAPPSALSVHEVDALARRAIHTGENVFSGAETGRPDRMGSSVLVVPIRIHDRVSGAIGVETCEVAGYHEGAAALLELFASQASVAVAKTQLHENLLERKGLEEQLRIAREVQFSLLPAGPPAIPGFEIHGMNVPSEAIGGDYYDFIPIVEGHLGVVIADVVGKGIPASLIMAGFRAFLRAEIRNNYAIRTIFGKVHNLLLESLASHQFVSAVYGVLDISRRRFTFSNAGHNPPILLRANGKRRFLVSGGPVLGVLPGSAYNERFVDLNPGDVMLFYTDGVVEAESTAGEMYGKERLERSLRASVSLGARALCQAIYEDVRSFSGGGNLADDTTIVALKCSP